MKFENMPQEQFEDLESSKEVDKIIEYHLEQDPAIKEKIKKEVLDDLLRVIEHANEKPVNTIDDFKDLTDLQLMVDIQAVNLELDKEASFKELLEKLNAKIEEIKPSFKKIDIQ